MTHITVGDISPRIQYIANGTQTVFSYPFAIFKPADMAVYLGDALQSGGFTVAGAGRSKGGTVTFGAAPAKGRVVTLRRELEISRTTDFQENGEFRSKVLNDELDYQTAVLQQVNEEVSRSVRHAPTSAATVSLTFPEPAANRLVGWNAGATALENKSQKVTGAVARTLSEGSRASASYDDATGLITLGVPIGATGNTGPAGSDGVFSHIASEAEAEAGTDTVKGMTPERTGQAIAALSPGLPAASIIASAGTTTPDGYLYCNGAAISRTTYDRLFTAIGTIFGAGDGSATFNLPDLRGEFLRGWDNGRGVDSGRGLGTAQSHNVGAHGHTVLYGARAGWASHYFGVGSPQGTTNGHANTQRNPTGETRPRNVAVKFYIKY